MLYCIVVLSSPLRTHIHVEHVQLSSADVVEDVERRDSLQRERERERVGLMFALVEIIISHQPFL